MSADAVLHARGKVRDVYEVGDRLLIVATDRISAFDAVLPTPIPDKGRVLTGLSLVLVRPDGRPGGQPSGERGPARPARRVPTTTCRAARCS